jgi:hypothetical protein
MLDKIIEELQDIRVEQAKQGIRLDTYNSQLETHMKRSDALEAKVDELYKFKYYVVGGLAIITSLLTVGLDLLRKWLQL